MPDRKSLRARPRIDRLDPMAPPSSVLPSHGLVDLRSTAIVGDLRDDLLRSTPHDGRRVAVVRSRSTDV